MNVNNEFDKTLKRASKDKEFRLDISEQSLLFFGMLYFPEYVKSPFANFHSELIPSIGNEDTKRLIIKGFRGCSKTVWGGLIYPIWCICFKKKNFMIFGSYDEDSIDSIMRRIVNELQENEDIINDFGELYYEQRGMFKTSRPKKITKFVTTNDVFAVGKSVGQKVRGGLYKQYRPDVFIGDDLETLKSTDDLKQCDKLYNWLTEEVIPGFDFLGGRVIILANEFGDQSATSRLANKPSYKHVRIPILDSEERINWPDRFVKRKEDAKIINSIRPKEQHVRSIEEIEEDIGLKAFLTEYMLTPPKGRIAPVSLNDIAWEDELPENFDFVFLSIDPNVEENDKSNYTGMTVWGVKGMHLYCINYLNEQLEYNTIMSNANLLYEAHGASPILIEAVQAQSYLVQSMVAKGLPAQGFRPRGSKEARLTTAAPFFKNKQIHFLREQWPVVRQIVLFHQVEDKDLCDSATQAILWFFLQPRAKIHSKRPKGF